MDQNAKLGLKNKNKDPKAYNNELKVCDGIAGLPDSVVTECSLIPRPFPLSLGVGGAWVRGYTE